MITNTYLPHVGGVAKSISRFSNAYRERGHNVLTVAPVFPDLPADETDVLRINAIQKFNGSDFSVSLPVPHMLADRIEDFAPDIVHSHHPFLLGDSALRTAARCGLPLVYTHHTLYEYYTHYVPLDADKIKRLAIQLQTSYEQMADHVIAPSSSVMKLIKDRGVDTPVTVIPTGVDMQEFEAGDRKRGRKRLGISDEDWLIGHVGRLAEEKNVPFLAEAIALAVQSNPGARALIVGSGEAGEDVRRIFKQKGLEDRLTMPGSLDGQELADAYCAMDLFGFASKTETQGMVLVEALAAGTPVVALNASGAHDIINDEENGRLVEEEDPHEFAKAIRWFFDLSPKEHQSIAKPCRATAKEYDSSRCAERALGLYQSVCADFEPSGEDGSQAWNNLLNRIREEWKIWRNRTEAIKSALTAEEEEGDE